MRKVLITGGCGFIGTNLIALMARREGYEVTVLDNESVGTRAALAGLPVARFVHGDIRDRAAVDQAMAGQEMVIHLAGQTGVMPSIADPVLDADVNVMGTLTLLEAARRHGAGRFVAASSSAPLGAQPPPMHEELVARPVSPYGASKLAMEGYLSAYWGSFGLKTVALRFSNCYGPGSVKKGSVVALFIRRLLAGEPLIVYGDGGQTRDFIHVEDLCRAVLLAVEGEPADPTTTFGRPFQVGSGTETSVNDLLARLKPLAEADGIAFPEPQYLPPRAGEIVRNYCDIGRFVGAFGFKAAIDLDQGLPGTWRYFLSLRKSG